MNRLLILIGLLALSGCASTTPVSVCPMEPRPPAEMLVAPEALEALPEDADMGEALATTVANNRRCVRSRDQLDALIYWWVTQEKAGLNFRSN